MPHQIHASYYHLTKALGEFQPAVGWLIRLSGHHAGQVLQFDASTNMVRVHLPDSLYAICRDKIANKFMDVIEVPYDSFQSVNGKNTHTPGTPAFASDGSLRGKVIYFKSDGTTPTVVGVGTIPIALSHAEYWQEVAKRVPPQPASLSPVGRKVPFRFSYDRPTMNIVLRWSLLKSLSPSHNLSYAIGTPIHDSAGKPVARILAYQKNEFETDDVGLVTIVINEDANTWWCGFRDDNEITATSADETLVNEVGPAPIVSRPQSNEAYSLPIPIPRPFVPSTLSGRAARSISL